MRIRLLAVGTRPPEWVRLGVDEYARRLRGLGFEVQEVQPGRGKDPRQEEGERLLRTIDDREHVVLLDVGGASRSTQDCARRLSHWQQECPRVALVIGGADGVSAALRARANESWSLSPLTFPHMLVRVIVAEQLYRAMSLNQGHPYHRE